MKTYAPAIGLALAASLLLAGCTTPSSSETPSPSASASEQPAAVSEITIALNSPPLGGWDPTGWTWDAPTLLQEAVYDGLIRATATGFAPALAESWEWVDPTTFRIKLREGVTFVDGEPLTAEVVAANIERFKNSANRFAGYIASYTGADIASDYELTLNFEAPVPDLELILSQQAGRMVSPNAIANPDLFAEGPQGVAAYLVNDAATTIDVTYALEKNPDYWDAASYPYDKITFEVQGDRSASFNALLAGQIDLFWGTPENVDAARSQGFEVYETPGTLVAGVASDMAGNMVPALADERVRQALNYAIDREAIAASVHPGTPAHQIFYSPYPSYVPALEESYPYDPDLARQLLADAGFEGFTLPVIAHANAEKAATAMAGYWTEIGVDVQLESLAPNDFIAKVVAGEVPFMVTLMTSQGPWNDIVALLSPEGGRNSLKYPYPQFTDLLQEALQAEGTARDAIYAQIAEVASELANTVPVVRETVFIYHSDAIQKLEVPQGQFLPALWSLAP